MLEIERMRLVGSCGGETGGGEAAGVCSVVDKLDSAGRCLGSLAEAMTMIAKLLHRREKTGALSIKTSQSGQQSCGNACDLR